MDSGCKCRFSIALTLSLVGCAATGPAFKAVESIPPGEATLYVYREGGLALGARSAYFYVNDINVFDLDRLGYSWVALPPGRYKLRQSWPVDVLARSTQFEIDLKAGEVRYFSFGTGNCAAGYREICYSFRELPAGAGRAAIADKQFQENFGTTKVRQSLEKK